MRTAQPWRLTFIVPGLIGLAALTGGCQTAEYRGASPSARNLNGDPQRSKGLYVGFDLNWSVDRPDAYHRADPMPVAAATNAAAAARAD